MYRQVSCMLIRATAAAGRGRLGVAASRAFSTDLAVAPAADPAFMEAWKNFVLPYQSEIAGKESPKKAQMFSDRPFTFFRELCVIFGKAQTTGVHAKAPGDVVVNLEREEANPIFNGEHVIARGGLERMDFASVDHQPPDMGTPGHKSEASTARKKRKTGQELQEIVNEVMERTTTVISTTIEKTAYVFSDAIKESILEQKRQLNSEQSKIEGLTIMECHKSILKIGRDRSTMVLFFSLNDLEKMFVREIFS